MPEAFKVLIKELQSLALDIRILDKNDEEIDMSYDDRDFSNGAKDLGITVTENKPEEDEKAYSEEVTEDDNEEYGDVNNYIVLEETEIEDYINSTDY